MKLSTGTFLEPCNSKIFSACYPRKGLILKFLPNENFTIEIHASKGSPGYLATFKLHLAIIMNISFSSGS